MAEGAGPRGGRCAPRTRSAPQASASQRLPPAITRGRRAPARSPMRSHGRRVGLDRDGDRRASRRRIPRVRRACPRAAPARPGRAGRTCAMRKRGRRTRGSARRGRSAPPTGDAPVHAPVVDFLECLADGFLTKSPPTWPTKTIIGVESCADRGIRRARPARDDGNAGAPASLPWASAMYATLPLSCADDELQAIGDVEERVAHAQKSRRGRRTHA